MKELQPTAHRIRYSLMFLRLLLPLSLFHPSLTLAAQAVVNDDLPEYSQRYDPQRDPFSDGRHALQLAKATKRRVLIEVGGEWCHWCHALDRFIHSDPAIREMLYRHFVVLKVNVSDEQDNAAFMKTLPTPMGYPHLYLAEHDGTVILSQDTSAFLDQRQYSPQLFLAFLKQWAPSRHEQVNLE